MDWTDEEYDECVAAWNAAADGDKMRAAITRAVAIVATRGGTMTAEDLSDALEYLGLDAEHTVQNIRSHVTVQGARVAALEAELQVLKADRRTQMADVLRQKLRSEQEKTARTLAVLRGLLAHLEAEASAAPDPRDLVVRTTFVGSVGGKVVHMATSERPTTSSERLDVKVQRKFKDAEEENLWANGWEEGLSAGHEKGAEAMRAACIETSRQFLDRNGLGHLFLWLKAEIEGATP